LATWLRKLTDLRTELIFGNTSKAMLKDAWQVVQVNACQVNACQVNACQVNACQVNACQV